MNIGEYFEEWRAKRKIKRILYGKTPEESTEIIAKAFVSQIVHDLLLEELTVVMKNEM